jgi:hypothetical protein
MTGAVPAQAANALDYWAAPAATGTGDGSSSANAAAYLNANLWSLVQSRLQTTNVTVNLLDGNYNAGLLALNDMGNPLHRLALQAANRFGPVFGPTTDHILDLIGSQNIGLDGLVFTGPTPYWGILCQPDYLKPCRNIGLYNCRFLNLTNAYYGAIGLLNGTRDVQIGNCTFTNIINGSHAHMIYASHNIVDVVLTNCVFQDCLADYVRFRDDAEYSVVDHCTFVSTMSASAFPFITSPLYNDTDPGPGDEFFGTYFQITSNSFTYNVSAGTRAALQFSDSGYDPQSYDCALTSSQASQLSGGATSFKQSFLQTNLGISASGVKMFGNTYNSRVTYHAAFTYSYATSATNAPQRGWQGNIDISDVPDSSGALTGPTPVMRNGNFDRRGLLQLPVSSSTPNHCLFRTWCANPKYTDILWHPGFNGTTNAMRFDATKSQYIYQWISNPTPTWTMDCWFALGSGLTGSGTKFKVDIFHDDIAGSKVSVGVDNLGRFGIYNGGTFTVLAELGTVAFSVDNNGNGNYTDPGDTLNVYRLRMVGNYAAASPYVSIYTSDANSPALNHQSVRRAYWVNGSPVSGRSAPGTIAFYNYTAPVVLDQIALASGLAEPPPVITNVASRNGQFIFSGTNGFAGDTYYVLSSTDLAVPLSRWALAATNTFDGTGSFSATNSMPVSTPRLFYRLQLQ